MPKLWDAEDWFEDWIKKYIKLLSKQSLPLSLFWFGGVIFFFFLGRWKVRTHGLDLIESLFINWGRKHSIVQTKLMDAALGFFSLSAARSLDALLPFVVVQRTSFALIIHLILFGKYDEVGEKTQLYKDNSCTHKALWPWPTQGLV